ncbi:MAG: adenylosuccinate synthase [Thermoanaerobaculia bacterium]|nr:adenylosuccinate synthase [Thermoanaerobaculia bacterium]
MPNTVVIGMQWGDEGKGKIVDLLCPAFDAVVRFQGGNNAGHTVKFGDRHFALHLVPSGVLHPGKKCVLGNGMVIHPASLFEELSGLVAAGVEVEGRLWISRRAHVILPQHIELDAARERARGGDAIGTTARGIGPAYEAKAGRYGLRVRDLSAHGLERLVEVALEVIGPQLEHLGTETAGPGETVAICRDWAARLDPYLGDVEELLNDWIDAGESLLFEGAQGTLLDLDHGTYPYVTSSSASVGGAATGTGVPPSRLDGVLGVLKAYTTRVGGGPFPTELAGGAGELLRERGNEFGTTTGRPRRCGWFDAVVARHTRRINGVDAIALTKLDVLDDLDEILVCTGYRLGGRVVRGLPSSLEELATAEPVYRRLPGWRETTVGTLDHDRLPARARAYVAAVEEEVGAPVALISSGPRREETVVRELPVVGRLVPGGAAGIRAHRDAAV